MVRFSQVGLRYPDPTGQGGERETLRDLSFTLPQGSFTWLTGPSGAGKTSLLRLMMLAQRPTRGEVEVLGVPLSTARRADLPKLRRRIGAVFQEFRLLPYLTAFDNVALPLRLAGRAEASLRPDVAEILRWVGLEGREDALPQQLSGGEQQRVAIARAVVTRPALLVADEPTGNLDPVQARRLLVLLAEMNRLGATVVVATHSRELIAQHPGHVMQVEAGRIVALDPWPYAMPDHLVEGWEGEPDPGQMDPGAAHPSPADPSLASPSEAWTPEACLPGADPLAIPSANPLSDSFAPEGIAEAEPEAGWVDEPPHEGQAAWAQGPDGVEYPASGGTASQPPRPMRRAAQNIWPSVRPAGGDHG
ncbi:cell division ATP-binding protein FtsE [Roseomonas xinghualingensis]|uniref:cell division ATP-binding protein FtsE n=1 Tax=Roseomonas xinghualingensis TaxID=2986475 RepID=UPI0021F2440C|nr:ATP-binding cassette domain-containing protein [Roseomonas sp. SXEYE001]MCV4205869.1 ATP-binding cassette domain-containing protein [Roseomonas sp. SXEYE001]